MAPQDSTYIDSGTLKASLMVEEFHLPRHLNISDRGWKHKCNCGTTKVIILIALTTNLITDFRLPVRYSE